MGRVPGREAYAGEAGAAKWAWRDGALHDPHGEFFSCIWWWRSGTFLPSAMNQSSCPLQKPSDEYRDGLTVFFPCRIKQVTLPDGTSIMDSLEIAPALEKLQPRPPLYLDSAYLQQVKDALPKVMNALAPIYVPSIPAQVLNPPSTRYFQETREQKFGRPLQELRDDPEIGGEKAWEAARPHLRKIGACLSENTDGPWMLGREPSYADFVVVGYLIMFERIGHLPDIVRTGGDEFQALWDASEGLRERGSR
jgi:glutathione S-transferase